MQTLREEDASSHGCSDASSCVGVDTAYEILARYSSSISSFIHPGPWVIMIGLRLNERIEPVVLYIHNHSRAETKFDSVIVMKKGDKLSVAHPMIKNQTSHH